MKTIRDGIQDLMNRIRDGRQEKKSRKGCVEVLELENKNEAKWEEKVWRTLRDKL